MERCTRTRNRYGSGTCLEVVERVSGTPCVLDRLPGGSGVVSSGYYAGSDVFFQHFELGRSRPGLTFLAWHLVGSM
jgi:hypothetical protein